MENQFNNLIEEIKKSRMTAVEKARIKLNIMIELEKEIKKSDSIVSPYVTRAPYFFRFSYSSLNIKKLVPITALSLVLIMGGLSYASTDSLPGDTLYPIKINLNEKIEEQLTFTSANKIALRQKRIEDRFTEVEELIKEKRITPENLSVAQSKIQIEKEKIKEDIEEMNKENPEVAIEVKNELESSITIRQENIDNQIEADKEIKAIEDDLINFEATLNEKTEISIEEITI